MTTVEESATKAVADGWVMGEDDYETLAVLFDVAPQAVRRELVDREKEQRDD